MEGDELLSEILQSPNPSKAVAYYNSSSRYRLVIKENWSVLLNHFFDVTTKMVPETFPWKKEIYTILCNERSENGRIYAAAGYNLPVFQKLLEIVPIVERNSPSFFLFYFLDNNLPEHLISYYQFLKKANKSITIFGKVNRDAFTNRVISEGNEKIIRFIISEFFSGNYDFVQNREMKFYGRESVYFYEISRNNPKYYKKIEKLYKENGLPKFTVKFSDYLKAISQSGITKGLDGDFQVCTEIEIGIIVSYVHQLAKDTNVATYHFFTKTHIFPYVNDEEN